MASKETASNKGRSQESGSSHEGTSPKTPWDTLKSFVAERGGDIYRRGIELGGTALSAIGARVEGFRSKRDDSRRIELTTPDSEADRNSVEDDKDKVSTSTPESQSGDSGGDEKNDKPVDGSEQDESGVEEDQQQEDSPEARLINRRKESVEKAKQRIEKIEKDENLDENTRNLSLSLARTDLEAAKTSLRAVEEQFGSSVDHSDKTDGDKPEQAKTTPETSTQAEEDDSSDDQAEKNSSAEGSQNSQDGGEQNQGQKPGSLAERIVAVRRQKVEEDQAKLDSLKPGSEEYKAAQAALKKSQERLDSAMKIVNSKEDSTTQEGATDDSAEMKPTDGHRSEQDEGGVEEDYQQEDSPEARLIKRRRESVEKARQRRDAITDDKSLEYQLADRDVEAAEIQLQAVEDQFGSSEQIKEESGADGKRDDIEDKNKGSAESQETSESEDDKKDKKSPEAPTPDNDLEKKVEAARNKYAEIRAEYEQTGMFKKLLKGKELKKRMELARAELEGYMTQLVYQQKDQERSIIANGVEGANEEEQKEARQKAIQSIAAAVLEQHALVDEKTQEEYDKRLDERSLFKKVAAKIGQWFVGKENKDGGKLGLGGWLRSGGAGLAAGVTLGIFGVSFPISSVVGSVSSAGVKVAAHQRALENARGEKRKLSDEELARFASGAQDLEWTTEEKDGSDRKDQSKEAVASMVGAALAETQKDTEKRQKNLTAIGSKAAMGWGLGVAAGRITTELIKSHIIPDQKPANVADTSGGKGTTLQEGQQGFVDSNFEATQPADVTDVPGVTVTPPSETVSLGPDGWVWDRVADVLGAEKATPFLEQLTQTNPDFQFIDLPDGVTGIAYKGNTDPQVVADAIGKVAPDLLKQWVLAA